MIWIRDCATDNQYFTFFKILIVDFDLFIFNVRTTQ